MLISEFKLFFKFKFNLLVSKVYINIVRFKILRLFLHFVISQAKNIKLLFYFILVSIYMQKVPEVFKKKRKTRTEFLGFFYKNGFYFLYNFLLISIPTLYYIFEVAAHFFNNESYLVIPDVPFLYEIEFICEQNSDFFDYFLDFKLVTFFKFYSKSLIISENEIRCLYKFPGFFRND